MTKVLVYILRTWTLTDNRQLWVICDQAGDRLVRARSKVGALTAWMEAHGHIDTYRRYQGILRPSEAAVAIASLRDDAKKSRAGAGTQVACG